MASIMILPNEILLDIARRVETQRDLASFGTACHRISEVVDTVLYLRDIGYALSWAVGTGTVGTIRRAVGLGIDVAAVCRCRNLLLRAAERGNAAMLEELLNLDGIDALHEDELGDTALHRAAVFGHAYIVKLLLQHGAEINAAKLQGFTALHHACSQAHVEVVDCLLQAGADVSLSTHNRGSSSLHCALYDDAFREDSEREQLGIRRATIVQRLIAHGADVNAREAGILNVREEHESPLDLAAKGNHVAAAQVLLDGGADVNSRSRVGITALHHAAVVQCRRGWRQKPEEMCIKEEMAHETMVKLLIDRGADVNADVRHTVQRPSHEVLLKTTPLVAAAGEMNWHIVNILVKHGADIDAKNGYGETALVQQALRGCVETVALLLRLGASPNQAGPGPDGETPLVFAVSRSDPHLAEMLLQHGADVNRLTAGVSPMTWAIYRAATNMVKLLLDHGADPLIDDEGGLIAASHSGYEPIIDLLLARGDEINRQTVGGRTALIEAVRAVSIRGAEVLIARGAQTEIKSDNGKTALHEAVEGDCVDMVRILLMHGADATATTDDGEDCLQIAVRQGYSGIAEVLRKHIQKAQGASKPPGKHGWCA